MSRKEICGHMSLLYSVATKPLDLWSKQISYGGRVRRVKDDLLYGDRVIEITGPHDNTIPTSITIPAKALDVLNVKLPVLVLVVKNLNLRFKLEVQIIDKERYRRRFAFVTYNVESLPSISASVAHILLRLEECWNLLEINLQALCYEAYGTDYEALQRITIHSNCHLRRVYLQDRHYEDDETPKMRQAFFDMVKRGINFIEKTCQTDKRYTGSLRQSDLNCSAKDNSISTPSRRVDLRKTSVGSTEKLKISNQLVDLNLHNSNVLKRNYMSLNALNDTIKMHNQGVFTRQSEWFTKFLVHDSVMKNKSEKGSSDVTKKEKQQYSVKTQRAGNSLLNIKIHNHMSQLASVELEKIAKSQFVKTHVSEIFQDNRFLKRPQKIQNTGKYVQNTHVNSRNCTLSNNGNNVQIEKNNSTDAKCRVPAASFSPAFKLDLSENIKLDKIGNNVSDSASDEYVISKYKYIKESEKNIANRLRSLVNIEESAEDTAENTFKRISLPLTEKETKADKIKSCI